MGRRRPSVAEEEASSQPPPKPAAPSSSPFLKRKMASGLRSLITGAKKLALGAGSQQKVEAAELFPKVDPAVDGEDCDHDCNSCVTHYPRNFSIDEEDELYGFVKGWSTHVLVATGKTDWVRDVADEKGSVMQAIDHAKVGPSNGVCCLFSRCDG